VCPGRPGPGGCIGDPGFDEGCYLGIQAVQVVWSHHLGHGPQVGPGEKADPHQTGKDDEEEKELPVQGFLPPPSTTRPLFALARLNSSFRTSFFPHGGAQDQPNSLTANVV
jgi:hypothetical protein